MQQAYPCFLSSEKNMPMTANDMKNQDFFYIPKLIISVLLNQHSVSKEQIFGSCKANTKKIIVLFSFWTWTQSQAIHPKLSEKDTLIPCHTQLNVCALAYSGVPNRRACTFINFEEKFPLHVYCILQVCIGICPARLLILRKNSPKHGLILVCIFNVF